MTRKKTSLIKVNATKTKVVRPTKKNFQGFGFWKKDEH
ncbi:MAG: Hypothetical protein LKU_00841 [Lactobacillus kefiranofaciens]|nr:hypothetical protein WANG_0326 [Lactobacillus kefiranofaciens subsp. kefiranofaciens]AGQ22911.1 hypothetical protein lhe_0325 [Lactobacillus helveticus CNRZ32]